MKTPQLSKVFVKRSKRFLNTEASLSICHSQRMEFPEMVRCLVDQTRFSFPGDCSHILYD
jgi:hypothetical protein